MGRFLLFSGCGRVAGSVIRILLKRNSLRIVELESPATRVQVPRYYEFDSILPMPLLG
jgi:hypothetical protein